MFGFGLRSNVKSISPPEAQSLLEAGSITLVDVRERSEWAQGHIPGSVLAPLSQFREAAPTLPTDKPVIFLCLSGARSAQAIGLCRSLGLAHDTHMSGGISAWRAHGFPLVR